MDLGMRIVVGGVVICLAVAAWRGIAAAARRSSRRRREAAGHGLGSDRHRHSYATRLADQQLADQCGDGSSRLVQEIAEEARWHWLPERERPLPWQEPRS